MANKNLWIWQTPSSNYKPQKTYNDPGGDDCIFHNTLRDQKEAGSSSNHHFSGVQGLFNFGRVDSIYAPVDGNGWKWPECTAFDVVWNGVSILWADTWCWSCCPSPMFIEFQVRNHLKLSERIWNSSVELIWGFQKFTSISYSSGVMNVMIR